MGARLDGKVAIVTGGGRGIGRAVARGLASAGAAVCVTARSGQEIEETARLITKDGGKALAVAGDVSQPDDVKRVVATTLERLGTTDVLVNNAGVIGPYAPVWCVDPEAWWRTQEIHQRGAFLYSHATFPGMIEKGGGHIITVSSMSGRIVNANVSAYGVAKAAQVRFTEFLALEGKEHNVFAFSISPGFIMTDMGRVALSDEGAHRWVPDQIERWQNLKETGNPEESLKRCAEMCVNLASGRANRLSGRFLTPEDDFAALVRAASD